jgi:hypothetical protein
MEKWQIYIREALPNSHLLSDAIATLKLPGINKTFIACFSISII